jgi:predicted membrane-bound mannosyltransferase
MQRNLSYAASSRGKRRSLRAWWAIAASAGAIVTAFAALVMLATPTLAQSRTLKMQSTWPASLTLQDNFKFFAEPAGR